MLHRGEHFPHNYNAVSRSAFYTWLNRHFKLGQTEPVVEKDYTFLPGTELTVWDSAHPAPKRDDADLERRLLRWWNDDAQKTLTSLSPDEARRVQLGALETMIGRGLAQVGNVGWKQRGKSDRGPWLEITGTLENETHHEQLPVVFCHPKEWNGTTVAWLTGAGKAGLFRPEGGLIPAVQSLVDSGTTVMGVDLLYQGEFLVDGKPLSQSPKVKETRESAAYTFGYNSTVFAQRVQDILSVVQFVRHHERPSKHLVLVGVEGAGPWVAAARALTGNLVSAAVVDTGGFRFGKLLDYRDPNFLPGGAKYGDVPGLLALGAPGRTLVLGESAATLAPAQARYASSGAASALELTAAWDPTLVSRWLSR